MGANYYYSHNEKVHTAIFEDYFIEVQLFKSNTSVEIVTGKHAADLRRERNMMDGTESNKAIFQNVMERAISIINSNF